MGEASIARRVARRSSSGPWIAAALGIVVALVALYALLGRSGRAPDGTPGAIGTAGYLARVLPDGTNLRFPAESTEAKFLAFIESNTPADRETWYELERTTFETDSATLRAQSREQLSNVAAILKAYPSVRLKIGGYTDNSGDATANQRLSQARAESVMNELGAMGVSSSRLEAEGYGAQASDRGRRDGGRSREESASRASRDVESGRRRRRVADTIMAA